MSKKLNDKLFDAILEEAMEKYAEDIANEEVPDEMTEEERAEMERQKDIVYQNIMKQIRKEERPRRRLTWKKSLILVAVIGVILAMCMSVSAIRSSIYKTFMDLKGTVLKLRIADVDKGQYDGIDEFADMDKLVIPGWLPPGMKLSDIEESETFVNLFYEGGDIWISLQEEKFDAVTKFIQTENNTYSVKTGEVLGAEAQIINMEYESGIHNTGVTWSLDDVFYDLTTNIDDDALVEAILNNMEYYQ